MATVKIAVGPEEYSAIQYKHVYIKANGWVKAYDDPKEPDPEHYPPHKVNSVSGKVTYESPHGQI